VPQLYPYLSLKKDYEDVQVGWAKKIFWFVRKFRPCVVLIMLPQNQLLLSACAKYFILAAEGFGLIVQRMLIFD
jgi:hypothetical protein